MCLVWSVICIKFSFVLSVHVKKRRKSFVVLMKLSPSSRPARLRSGKFLTCRILHMGYKGSIPTCWFSAGYSELFKIPKTWTFMYQNVFMIFQQIHTYRFWKRCNFSQIVTLESHVKVLHWILCNGHLYSAPFTLMPPNKTYLKSTCVYFNVSIKRAVLWQP